MYILEKFNMSFRRYGFEYTAKPISAQINKWGLFIRTSVALFLCVCHATECRVLILLQLLSSNDLTYHRIPCYLPILTADSFHTLSITLSFLSNSRPSIYFTSSYRLHAVEAILFAVLFIALAFSPS